MFEVKFPVVTYLRKYVAVKRISTMLFWQLNHIMAQKPT